MSAATDPRGVGHHPPDPLAPFPPHIQAALEAAAYGGRPAEPEVSHRSSSPNFGNPTSKDRRSSDRSTSTQVGDHQTPFIPPQPLHYFPRDLHLPVYSCAKCLVAVALQDELVSKAFSGRSGRALLLHSTQNTHLGAHEQRRLLTGVHTVADLLCSSCGTSLGWMYLKAMDRSQEYKEGKYILEMARIIKENNYALSGD